MKMFSVRLPDQLIRNLDKKRRKLKISRSALVRQLLETGLDSTSESPLTLHGLRSELLSEIQNSKKTIDETGETRMRTKTLKTDRIRVEMKHPPKRRQRRPHWELQKTRNQNHQI